jgi:hypothetical protein
LSIDAVTAAYTGATFDNKNVGMGKIVSVSGISISGKDALNYNLKNTTAATTADITQRDLTVSAHGINRVYDGTMAATVTLTDNALSDDLVADHYTSASFANKNVGTAKAVNVSGISIDGADSGNYHLTNSTATTIANITPLSTGSFTAADKVWDGTTVATVLTRSTSNAIAGDDVSLSGGTANFDTANVGPNKTVTLTGAVLVGRDAGNYALNAPMTTTANITAWNASGKGFYAPVGVANSIFTAAPGTAPPTKPSAIPWNTVKGGQTVPLKFNVFAGTVEKTSLSDIKSFQQQQLPSCGTDLANADPVDVTTTGGTTLRYDTTGMQWIQNWGTSKVNTTTCYRAIVTFADSSTLEAFFQLSK